MPGNSTGDSVLRVTSLFHSKAEYCCKTEVENSERYKMAFKTSMGLHTSFRGGAGRLPPLNHCFSTNSMTRGSPPPPGTGRYVTVTGVPGFRSPQRMLSLTAEV